MTGSKDTRLEVSYSSVTVKLPSRVTDGAAFFLRQDLLAALNNADESLSVDLSETEFIDFKGIECLVELTSEAKKQGKRFIISSVSEELSELLDRMHLTDVFDFAPKN